MSNIGERLRYLRISKGMTMEETAKQVGAFGRSVVSNWEKGKTTPKPQFMKAYADVFGVSQEWIRKGTQEPTECDCLAASIIYAGRSELSPAECVKVYQEIKKAFKGEEQ